MHDSDKYNNNTARLIRGHEAPEGGQLYSFLNLGTRCGGWSTPRPGKETRHPLYRRLVGPRSCLDGCGKSAPSPGFDPRTVQPVASRYTDSSIAEKFRRDRCTRRSGRSRPGRFVEEK